MVISLPLAKVNKIISQCQLLLDKTSPTVREVAQVSGLLVSSFRAVKYMKLFVSCSYVLLIWYDSWSNLVSDFEHASVRS